MVTSRSRWRFFGQVRLVLLFNQMKPSLSSNQTGFNCTDPSARLVATVTRMGSAASFWTAGLSADGFLPPAIDGAGDAQRLDLDLDAAGPRALIILLQVPMGQVIDMVAPCIFSPVDHAALDLGPAKHFLRVDQQQRDPRVALEMFEPAAIRPAIDPERAILELEPHRDHLDTAVFTVGPDDGRKDLLGECLHFWTELDRHHTTSHLKSRVARTTEMASHTNMPNMSPRTAQSEAPSTLILRSASET